MGLFDRVLRGVSRAVSTVAKAVERVVGPSPIAPPKKAPTKPKRRASERAPAPPPPAPAEPPQKPRKSTPAADRAALARDMGADTTERQVGGDAEIETWMAALRARADKFAPGLLDELAEWLESSGASPDDEVLTDVNYETDKGGSPL